MRPFPAPSILVPRFAAVSEWGHRLPIGCAANGEPPDDPRGGTTGANPISTAPARLRRYLEGTAIANGGASPRALSADILEVVTARTAAVMRDSSVPGYLQRSVKFWAALDLLLRGVPAAIVETACLETRPGKGATPLIRQYLEILDVSEVRDALAAVRKLGLAAFLRDVIPADRLSGTEVSLATRITAGGELAARTLAWGAEHSAGTAADVSVGIEFLPSLRPYFGIAQRMATRDRVFDWMRRNDRRAGYASRLTRDPQRDFEFAPRFPIAIVIQETFRERGRVVNARRWVSRGVVLFSVQQDGDPSTVVERSIGSETVFDAEGDTYAVVAKLLSLSSVDELYPMRRSAKSYGQRFRFVLHAGPGETAVCNVRWDRANRAVVEPVNGWFERLRTGERLSKLSFPDAETPAELVAHLRGALAMKPPPYRLRKTDRFNGIVPGDDGAVFRILSIDDPYLVLESPWLRHDQLPMLGRLADALAQCGFVGATETMPVGQQVRAKLPVEEGGMLSVDPLLRVLRSYLDDAEAIEALLAPRRVRRAFLRRVPPGLERLLRDPTYAPRPGNVQDLLCFLADCHRFTSEEYCEVNIVPYLEALATALRAQWYNESPFVPIRLVEDWHGSRYQFRLTPPERGEISVIYTSAEGVKSYDLTPQNMKGRVGGLDGPYVELRLGNSPAVLDQKGIYRIASDAILWLARFWADYCRSRSRP